MAFNEDSRVKIPTILHLIRLGYGYLSLKEQHWDHDSNIFPELFEAAVTRINPELGADDARRQLAELRILLDNEDLGEAFYERLRQRSGVRLVDFENFDNNSFHVVTELPCINGDDEFRPDITLLINGLPLVFIEVKKPNNREGVLAERDRIGKRFANNRFRRFINATQFMLFSNNMEYDDNEPEPVEGAFYAGTAYGEPEFNHFREELPFDTETLAQLTDEDERRVLQDTNTEVIRSLPEFALAKQPDTPTNRLCTALLRRSRLAFTLQYAMAYVKAGQSLQKHIMRYPQFFATKAIARTLDRGTTSGIIWHTQGSGKTALAYYNVHYLTDYFQQRGVVPKFYFIVDRLDLLDQASSEFRQRGLIVHTVNSRDEFKRDIKASQVIHNDSGQREITVVNIQKFQDDPAVAASSDYSLAVQRIYFLDEVHRSYNPQGSFLANLKQSDSQAIKIGLTGTPLLGHDYNSRMLFGDYIHKYYYNASIADGYTLRLIREGIATNYRLGLAKVLEEIKVQVGDVERRAIFAHPRFVEPMLDYIVNDFERSRAAMNDPSIGGMVICDSAEQARQMHAVFMSVYADQPEPHWGHIGEAAVASKTKTRTSSQITRNKPYADKVQQQNRAKTAGLILHDEDDKPTRKNRVEDFKQGKIDLLFVYNMLLTGFNAKRLKKLYLGRSIKAHNLLQALTRVNRRYKQHRYGYVVDFVDIRKEFDQANRDYFDELQAEYGDETQHYSQLFKTTEEIQAEIAEIKDSLFEFDTDNPEQFSRQISAISDRKQLLEIKNALANARSLYNIIRLQGHGELLQALDFAQLTRLFRETENRLHLLNLKQSMDQGQESGALLHQALEDTLFLFTKVGEAELKLADQLQDSLRRTREALSTNMDKDDPAYVTLREELKRLLEKGKLSEVDERQLKENIDLIQALGDKAKNLNQLNQRLSDKYNGDGKFARLHKRLMAQPLFNGRRVQVQQALMGVKRHTDQQLLDSSQLLGNEKYFSGEVMRQVIQSFRAEDLLDKDPKTARQINQLIVTEYMNEYKAGQMPW